MEFASRATLAATTLIVLTLLLHRLESPPPPPSPSHATSIAAPPLRTEPATQQQQPPAALPRAGNGSATFWHVTDWHLNLFHKAEGCADPYVPGPPYCTYRLRVPASCVAYVPEAQGSCCATLRTPYAYEPRACRTYRVPCGAPQADGDVRDMCRTATADRMHWPGPYARQGSNPSSPRQGSVPRLAGPKQACYSHVWVLLWTGSATSTVTRRGRWPSWRCTAWLGLANPNPPG